MSRFYYILAFVIFSGLGLAQDSISVNFLVDAPFAKNENNVATGMEIDILNEYISWLKTKKNVSLGVKYIAHADQTLFYEACKKGGKNTIGLGGQIVAPERLKEIDFSTAYLKNVAFCITNGNAPDIKTKTPAEIVKALGSMTALNLPNSNLSKYIAEIKKTYIKDLKTKDVPDQIKMLDEISKNVLVFGYVEAIEFWFYLKSNPQKFLKMQKAMNQSKEEIAFVLPKGSQHKAWFNEFFAGPDGFKNGQRYRAILEKYVGSYMTQNMAVN